MSVYCCDIETTGFIGELLKQGSLAKLHNFGAKEYPSGKEILFSQSDGSISKLQSWLDEGHTLIIHNGICFDTEALSILGYDCSKNDIIDSLGLSWYLNPTLKLHGLEAWGETFGVPKPPVIDWINGDPKEYDHRVMQDCRIQFKLWEMQCVQLGNLYDTQEGRDRIIKYLNFKMYLQKIQQKNRWKLDIEGARKLLNKMLLIKEEKFNALQKSMPCVPVKAKKTRPAKPFKKNGDLSATGIKWKELCDEHNLPFDYEGVVEVVTGYVEPNAGSHAQVKNWLFSLGWEPQTFDFKRNKETGEVRKIPQISAGKGKICKSINILIKENPDAGIEHLAGLGIINHRISIVNGFLRDVDDDGYIVASCNGFTNTLRLKHSGLVNLPSTRVPYGKEIRGLLGCPEGYQNIGSDLSSLEDRCKHHFQWKHDPEYVKQQMADDFDPHLLVCEKGGLLTPTQIKAHKDGVEDYSHIRHLGKGGNYACQYGAGVATLERQLKIDNKTAKAVHKGYWDLNWSIKQIAKSTTVKAANGYMWQWNPVAKLWYWLKADKDRFSTLCQGLGAFIFDKWSEALFDIVRERWGREAPYVAQFHDELVLMVRKETLKIWHDVLKEAIKRVGDILKLNRELDCDVQIGDTYADIH